MIVSIQYAVEVTIAVGQAADSDRFDSVNFPSTNYLPRGRHWYLDTTDKLSWRPGRPPRTPAFAITTLVYSLYTGQKQADPD